ncbi:uncharacterized protein LOC115976181 isoform X2 [Quercus lobata]|uniref:uncharacterized protein LOC115976181 isoform X2 n=1 Tax=Quercus lobata TaxID=97700 RepID=UPI0012468E41|nr:uncharacterized protein LOC115976181 isoform X2 [Quercus lobata]
MHSAERLHSTMEICGGLTQETTLHFHPFARMGLLEAFLSVFGTLVIQKTCSYKGIMSAPESIGNNTQKKLIKIVISLDTVCPWCFVGKKNLDKAIAASKDHYDFKGKYSRQPQAYAFRWAIGS